MLAEDNPINQEIGKAMLNAMSCSVTVAINGLDALSIYHRGETDLILMDCMMPEMDGYTASQQIRQYEITHNLPPVPILALTANAMEGDREKCLNVGMNDYLAKPFLQDTLRNKIISMLDIKPKIDFYPGIEISLSDKFDPTRLNQLKKMGGNSLISNLILMFQSSCQQQIDSLRQGFRQQDTDMIRLAAHTLKSAAANMGGLILAKQAGELEFSARKGTLIFDEQLINNLQNEFEVLLTIISQQQAV